MPGFDLDDPISDPLLAKDSLFAKDSRFPKIAKVGGP